MSARKRYTIKDDEMSDDQRHTPCRGRACVDLNDLIPDNIDDTINNNSGNFTHRPTPVYGMARESSICYK